MPAPLPPPGEPPLPTLDAGLDPDAGVASDAGAKSKAPELLRDVDGMPLPADDDR